MPGKRLVHHVPPRSSCASRMTKLRFEDCSCRWRAAPIPETPAPTMRTSKWPASWTCSAVVMVCDLLSLLVRDLGHRKQVVDRGACPNVGHPGALTEDA